MFQRININPLSLILGFVFIGLFIMAAFYIAQGIFTILMWLAPVLLVATLILDYKVVLNYGKWVLAKFSRSPLSGVTWSLITVFGFPVVIAFLLFKAITQRKLAEQHAQWEERNGEYIEYVEVQDSREKDFIRIPDSFK
jgi:hypothetical protein